MYCNGGEVFSFRLQSDSDSEGTLCLLSNAYVTSESARRPSSSGKLAFLVNLPLLADAREATINAWTPRSGGAHRGRAAWLARSGLPIGIVKDTVQ